MWRQVLVICLLITLSDFWSGVQASLEREFNFNEDVINNLARRYEIQRRNDHISNDRPIDEAFEGGLGGAEIAKDVQDPGDAEEPPADTKTGDNTKKINDTGKTTSYIHGAQPLGSDHNQKPALGSKTVFPGTDVVFIVTIAACSVAGLIGILMAGVCWYKLNRSAKAASDVEYPAYGVTGPNKERIPSPGDRKLAQSAQMYHYQHQKQQMIAMEKANGEMKHDASDEESEEENEEGDYTVYECPGLAPTGEMEVKNPLFSDETPVTPSAGDAEKKDGSE